MERNTGEFVMTKSNAIFHQDVSFYMTTQPRRQNKRILWNKEALILYVQKLSFLVPGQQVDERFEPPEEGEKSGGITMKQMPWLVSLGGYLGM